MTPGVCCDTMAVMIVLDMSENGTIKDIRGRIFSTNTAAPERNNSFHRRGKMLRRYFVGKRTGNGEYSGSGGGEHVGSGLADAQFIILFIAAVLGQLSPPADGGRGTVLSGFGGEGGSGSEECSHRTESATGGAHYEKYYAQTADQEDLISIGTIGLIKGITTFDASKGARLATYAARCVENAILT